MRGSSMQGTEKLLSRNSASSIYFLAQGHNNRPAVRKVLNEQYPDKQQIRRFLREYELLCELDIQGVRRAYDKHIWDNRHAILLEFVTGITVDELLAKGFDLLPGFLDIALRMSRVVEDLHGRQIIHNNINGRHFIIDPSQHHAVTLIDFSNASRAESRPPYVSNPEHLPADLHYISPEQTGRMNRNVDNRSDLYSLGVLFYKMLTGELPFQNPDPMELMHGHIAVIPRSPNQLNPTIPPQIAAIVMKLLAKNAEDRYQSACGLRKDLTRCCELLATTGKITLFDIACNDSSGFFKISEKLYGREAEVEQLLKAFDSVNKGGLKLMLVAGYSGTGKTSLVNETHKPITAQKGEFIRGKYDQFQRNVPYYAIIQAFDELNHHILGEDEAVLDQWRQRLQQAVGTEGRVLTEIMPNLELIIGEQPEVPQLAGKESQNRFIYLFRNFTRAIACEGHPLVLFLDDLQWADLSSLELLKALLTDPESSHLLCVCAYRDNEVSPSHPMVKAINQLEEDGADIEWIEVRNLMFADTNQLIADSLHKEIDQTQALAEIVYNKTQGNAFFLRQFLTSLYQEGYLDYHFEDGHWCWDVDAINKLDMTDNVVDLMTRKIRRLSADVQQVLTIAACIGNLFDLETLSLSCQHSIEDTSAIIDQCHQEGLVVIDDNQVSFVHDRIQQAAYSLTPAADRASLHLRIGRILLAGIPDDKRQERIFDIVNQFNQGIALINNEPERTELAALNLAAGIRAKSSAAYAPALNYFSTGYSLLSDSCWQDQYELTLQIATEQAETAYLTGNFDEMDTSIARIMTHARELLDKVKAYETQILAHKARNQLLEAIDTGLDILAQLGVHFPDNPTQEETAQALSDFQALLAERSTAELLELPEMTDPAVIAAVNIMTGMNSSIYWARAELFPFMVFKFVELSLKNGNTATSAFGYSLYGVMLSGAVGDMKRAYDFGLLGLQLVEKFGAREWLTQLYTPHYALIVPWNEHTRITLQPLLESYHIGFETGAIEYAIININLYCIHSFLCGVKLEGLESEIDSYSQAMLASKQETNYQFNQIYHQCVLNLMGRSTDPLRLVGEAYNEEIMLPKHLQANDMTASYFVFFLRMMLCYLFGDLQAAKTARDEAETRLSAILAKLENSVFNFYDSLLSLALYPDEVAKEQSNLLARVEKNQQQLQAWAGYAPMNFQHKFLLVEAERNRVLENHRLAWQQYDQAIALARDNQYFNEAALAYELAGNYVLGLNDKKKAREYLRNAYQMYSEWEAVAKAQQLASRYPGVFDNLGSYSRFESVAAPVVGVLSDEMERLDLHSVLKAATAISEEIVLSRLLERLMQILLQSAGAQRGLILLPHEGRLYIEAELEVHQNSANVLQHLPLDQVADVPKQVLLYVARAKEQVVIGDAADHDSFPGDAYLAAKTTSSLLCSPIINRGKLLGLLYLENNLIPNAFTEDRMELLRLISGQVAVSLNNAILFDELEQRVAARTASLEQANQKLERLTNLDGLTELFNRRFFDFSLEREWLRLRRLEKPISLIFCDVDFFKQYNDTQGHIAGDECLRQIARILRKCTKRPTDVSARYGGEEFVILLPETDKAGACAMAEAIHKELVSLAIPHISSPIAAMVTLSFGVSTTVPKADDQVEAFLARADSALYESKKSGRNKVTFLPFPS